MAGGMENMNLAPYLLTRARFGYRLGNAELVDAVVHDGLWCPCEQHHMGMAAEWIATEYGITRDAEDQFALLSHRQTLAAMDAGRFRDEIVPVPAPQAQRKGPHCCSTPTRIQARHEPGRTRQVEAGLQRGRNGHGRQRARHHGWRRRASR